MMRVDEIKAASDAELTERVSALRIKRIEEEVKPFGVSISAAMTKIRFEESAIIAEQKIRRERATRRDAGREVGGEPRLNWPRGITHAKPPWETP